MSMMLNRSRMTIAALGLLGTATFAGSANAVMVTPGTNASEPSVYQVMNNLYGSGNWTQLDSSAMQTATNSGISLGFDYQIRYAADNASFGVFKDNTAFSSFLSITSNTPSATSVTITSSDLSTNIGGIWSVGLRNDVTGQLFSSDATKNADGRNHLIIFAITNLANTYVMAWEDMLNNDYDYQDLILQYVATANPPPRPVPEPMTLSLLGAALVLGGGTRRYLKGRSAA